MKIVEIREKTLPISSSIRNAYIDFSKMNLSLVAVVTDVIRDGKPVIGYGFNSNGRYGQGTLMRERFIPRILEADPASLVDETGHNLCPHKIWQTMFTNEKPGGHGERSVAIGTIDMAIWDAVAKIEGKPLFQLLADRYGDTEMVQSAVVKGRTWSDVAALAPELEGQTPVVGGSVKNESGKGKNAFLGLGKATATEKAVVVVEA